MRKFKIFLINGDYIISKGESPYLIQKVKGITTFAADGELYILGSFGGYSGQSTKQKRILLYPHSVISVIEID